MQARQRFAAECRRAVELGDEPAVGHALMHLAEIDCWLGDWEQARAEAAQAVEAIRQTGQRRWLGFGLYSQALVAAHRGEVVQADESARQGLDLARAAEDPYTAALHCQVLGFLELSRGDPYEADRHLSHAARLVTEMRIKEPARYMFHGDQIEAAVELGDTDRAARLFTALDRRLAVAPRPWLVAIAARTEAVLRLAEGDQPAAEAAIDRSVAACLRLGMPFELARTLLVQGRLRRAGKQKRTARESLVQSRQIFDQLDAPLWSRRAEAELLRCGGHRTGPDELTATEQRVAALVAGGLSNREVAALAYLSPKTVEANLSRVYRKLGVRNRRELARGGQFPVSPPPVPSGPGPA
jgi:DNA-binding CsgD family transcriptional regulator